MMNGDEHRPQSFSLARRWGAGLNLLITLAAVLAILAMVNYLAIRHFVRWNVTPDREAELSRRTRQVLKTLTNDVNVTLYFNSEDDLFPRVRDLLKDYQLVSPRVRVRHVDYLRDPAAAQQVKAQYNLDRVSDRDIVIFDGGGTRRKVVNSGDLSDYDYSNLTSGKGREVYRTHFKGEMFFTSAIYSVASARSPKACFLIGHQEHHPGSTDAQEGYSKFASVMQNENNFELAALSLLGTNDVPRDCNLLIVAGPLQTIGDDEAEKIQRYLEQGGRMLALFNFATVEMDRRTGLEKVLQRWGVEVDRNVMADPDNSAGSTQTAIQPSDYGAHPIVNSLGGSRLFLFNARSIRAARNVQRRDELKIEELLFTGPNSFAFSAFTGRGRPAKRQPAPRQSLAVAVERSVAGLERGSTRIVVMGDSTLWNNQLIELEANREFAAYVVNWLASQNLLLADIPRRAIRTYKLTMTRSQVRTARWLLLAGMPGVVLFAGFLVWVRRRN